MLSAQTTLRNAAAVERSTVVPTLPTPPPASDVPTAAVRPETLAEDHLYLVTHIVRQLSGRYPRHVDRRELHSVGFLGLVEAARNYDPDSGVPFTAFARRRIRGALLDAARSRDWMSRGQRQHAHQLATAEDELRGRLRRDPTSSELATELGWEPRHVEQLRGALHQGETDVIEVGAEPADPAATGRPDAALEHRELLGTMRAALAYLPEPQRSVLHRHYLQNEPLKDIADDLGVTGARVSQLRSEALAAVRAYFQEQYGGTSGPTPAGGVRARDAFLAEVRELSWRDRVDGVVPAP